MPRFHPASLVDPEDHPQDLLDFFELDAQDRCVIGKLAFQLLDLRDNPSLVHSANEPITDYFVHTTTDVAAHALRLEPTERMRSGLLSLSDRMHNKYCGFSQFVSNVVRRSRTRTSTVLVALLYLRRAKLHVDVPPVEWILHRLFLGALILATKVRHILPFLRDYTRFLILLASFAFATSVYP